MSHRLAIDVGGTFTDVALLDSEVGKVNIVKLPSTPENPSEGVMAGIEKICALQNVEMDELANLIHGTTVATNTVLEHKGERTALITTQGFRDLLHIGRQIRPKLYDFRARRPEPLVPRNLRFEISERIYSDGRVLKKLDEEGSKATVQKIKEENIKSVALCLLHSYINPEHERRLKRLILEECPDVYVSISSEVLPEFREYERVSTTVINAYVMPVIEKYLFDCLLSLLSW